MNSGDETTGPRTFEAWGYKTLFMKVLFSRVAVLVHVKNKCAVWALGVEFMAIPHGFCIFLGPISVGFFNWPQPAAQS